MTREPAEFGLKKRVILVLIHERARHYLGTEMYSKVAEYCRIPFCCSNLMEAQRARSAFEMLQNVSHVCFHTDD